MVASILLHSVFRDNNLTRFAKDSISQRVSANKLLNQHSKIEGWNDDECYIRILRSFKRNRIDRCKDIDQ